MITPGASLLSRKMVGMSVRSDMSTYQSISRSFAMLLLRLADTITDLFIFPF